MPPALQFLVLTFAGWVNRHQDDLIAYLREENRVLREHLGPRPLRLTDAQRRRLAVRGQKLGRRVWMQVAGIVTPDTILRWYRRLIAQTYDGSARRAARRFFRKLLESQRQEPCRLVTDKLGSYGVAHRNLMPWVPHDTNPYANNRAEVSHQPTRQRERQMRGFTSPDHAQRFLHVHGVIQNLFRVGRHRLRSVHHRMLRARSFTVWAAVTAARAADLLASLARTR